MSQLFLLATLLLVGVAQSQYIEWTVEDYPNPMVEPAKCGRPASLNMSKVCDPNGIISQKDADLLDHILVSLPSDTPCPCSAYSCENRRGATGYHMAVALVRKIKRRKGIPNTREATEGLAGQFALKLQKTKWRSGVCDESVVIFYSKEDGVLRTMQGKTARLRLTDHIAGEIQREMARFFQNDRTIGQGLHYLAANYRRVLYGEPYLPIRYTDVAGAAAVKMSFLTCLITTILLKIFC